MFIGKAYAKTGSDTCVKKDRELLRFVSTMSQMNHKSWRRKYTKNTLPRHIHRENVHRCCLR